ncbi:hypothetical protein IAU60_001090 [Kwoniella sp. DSM 27419]
MSRNPPPNPSTRYKISSPQPLAHGDLRSAYTGSDTGPYPSFPPSQPSAQSSYPSQYGGDSLRAPRQNGEPSRNGGPPPASPARPARSRMREAPQPPSGLSASFTQSSASGTAAPAAPAVTSRRDLRPIQTSNFRRPSATGSTGSHDLAVSPISPVSPVAAHSGLQAGGALFSDPFAADRNQRTELRAQTSAAVQQTMPSGPATDKLRTAVGAFMSAGKQREDPSAAARRPVRSEGRERARKSTRDEMWDVTETGGKFSDIDEVLSKIRKDWPFVMESDFSPSTLALSLLSQGSSSSLPAHPNLPAFLTLHESLSTALQTAVQSHFQSFAASLPAHATFIATLSKAQEQVKKSKEGLREARDGFAGKGKSELASIRARERMVRDMLKILDTVDNLKQVPDQLESLIGDKRFLKAALILVRSLKTINKPELEEIGALSDLRTYLAAQETTLTEILVEELHSHIYLKTYYSDSRWKAYTLGQQQLPIIDPRHQAEPSSKTEAASLVTSDAEIPAANGVTAGPSSRLSRYLNNLATKPSQDPLLDFINTDLSSAPSLPRVTHQRAGSNSLGQAGSHSSLASLANGSATPDSGNPEADSYAYMETLLEALASMGKLSTALEMVSQRVPGEIHTLVESTLDEVEERSERRREEVDHLARPQSFLAPSGGSSVRPDSSLVRKSLFAPAETLRIEISLGATGPPQHAAILRDLFWTLYSKLAAVLEGHRVVYEVSRWISSRRDFKDGGNPNTASALNVPVLEFWKPIQQEVRTILRTYLTDDSQGSPLDQRRIMTINEVLREGKIARDKQKQMFKFSDTDTRAVQNEIKAVDDSLQQALRASVPGLVSMQAAGENTMTVQTEDDRYSTVGRHRTLIPPNAFNVTTLFQPTLSFIQRATSIVPPGFEDVIVAFSTVLEDFVVKVFLPQLDERVTASFQQAVSGYDAYQVDRQLGKDLAIPPLKSSVRVMALLHSLCTMLQTTPFHRENYSRLVVGVIVQYYQQCSSRFKELASLPTTLENVGETPMALPAVWAQRDDIISVLNELRAVPPTDRVGLGVVEGKEIKLEMELLGDQPLVEKKLIHSVRKLEALGNLSQSLRWFIDSLLDLQSVADEPMSPSDEEPAQERTLPVASPLSVDGDEPRLPLTRAMAQRYEAIIQTYEQLAEMVLNTIRLEIRGRVLCNLGAALRTGDFRLESEAFEPDPDVLDLNHSLMDIEEIAERTILGEDHSFVFRGLGQLVDQIFISSARNIKMVNPAGVRKIKRNILALQQTLRGIGAASFDGTLDRAVEYWDLYDKGPKRMLEELKQTKPVFSFEDYNTMLNLQCKADQDDAPSSELNTYLIDLHALSMSIEGWEIGES